MGSSSLFGMLSSSWATERDSTPLGQWWKGRMLSPALVELYLCARGEKLLGGSEYLFFSASVEGELVPLFAHKYCTPRAPFFFGSEKDHLLFALFARKDALLLWKTLHVYAPPSPL
jgi:hypothetical protein